MYAIIRTSCPDEGQLTAVMRATTIAPMSAGAAIPLLPAGFVAVRTPLLPLAEFTSWADGLPAADGVDVAAHVDGLRTRLRDWVARPEVREAIFVASPTADQLVEKWLAAGAPPDRPLERTLTRYLARMAGRCTPFGLFAGMSTGTVGSVTRLELVGRDRYGRVSRLDAAYLGEVLAGTIARPEVRETLTYRANPSLYRSAGRWRYVLSRPGAEEGRHQLTAVRDSEALRLALETAAGGCSLAALRSALARIASAERVARFVDDLVAQQVIVPDVEIQLTGGDATYGLAAALGDVPELGAAAELLRALDASPPGQATTPYRELAASLEGLPGKVDASRLVQVDMAKPGELGLATGITEEALRGALLLHRVGRARDESALSRFVERFTDRFERRAVPIMEALDPDMGVPFDDDEPAAAPLLATLDAGRPTAGTWTERDAYLFTRLLEHQRSGAAELVLTQGDIEKLEHGRAQPIPASASVVAVVAASSAEAADRGQYQVQVAGIDGPSGARLLGRFCHVDTELERAVERHLRAEEELDSDAIYAEIVHLPRARDVNVSARPVLRRWEIPCLGRSGAVPECQLPLADLLVSVDGGRVVLHSRSRGRRVVPRLTSAHNYANRGVAVYRFLCAVQDQDAMGGGDFWGPLASAPALPRVRHGRAILALARWRLRAELLGPKRDTAADHASVQAWRRTWGVPRFVAQTDFGGQLPVDLENALSVDALVDDLRSRELTLVEMFPPPDQLMVRGPEGAFTHEMVIPFERPPDAGRGASRSRVDGSDIVRMVPPGNDWVYARIYTGETIADGVLLETVAPLAARLIASDVAHQWFFLRYRDTAFHLRVRFRGAAGRLQSEGLPAIHAALDELVAGGQAWRIEFGTYHREAERYGGPAAMDHIERLFHADSDAVVNLLEQLEPGEAGLVERWQIGLAGVDRLLRDLGMDLRDRLGMIRRHRDGLVRTLGFGPATMGKAGDRFRKERDTLAALLAAGPGGEHPLEPGLVTLAERSARWEEPVRALHQLEREGRLVIPIAEIAGSLVHMYLNRLLRGNNTAQELVISDFLLRLYQAEGRRDGAP
jgi:thiopeptide-type bacteriocin biosynthesis protein